MAALTAAQKKQAQRERERRGGRRSVSASIPADLADWLRTEAEALGQTKAERLEAILRERQQAGGGDAQ